MTWTGLTAPGQMCVRQVSEWL